MEIIGILGGTFDPVHCGHLRLALELREQLPLTAVHLIPASHPPHRSPPKASAGLRMKMLQAAVRDFPGLIPDDREVRRTGPSFTVDTVQSLRLDYPQASLCLIVGMDAFGGLATWHRWRELLEFAHLAVAHRPGSALAPEGEVAALLSTRLRQDPQCLQERQAGFILIREIPLLDISATRIRALLAQGRSARCLVPDAVLEIIRNHGIYRDAK